jgi:dihydropteroate synthase
VLDCKGKVLDLRQPQAMGILNITPDSFSDGGIFFNTQKAIERARQMVNEGAALIDVGGESTRPGAQAVSVQQELDRVIPVIEVLAKEISVPVSIDTSKADVMREAVAAGAGMINDVRALREERALQAAVDLDVPVCLMHMQGEPRTMQQRPHYDDVVQEVKNFLLERIAVCESAGISKDKIIIDPGFGFGKTLDHNLSLLKHLTELTKIGLPVLVGVSRKSMIGNILHQQVDNRLFGSIALASLACFCGAAIIRAHDVQATVEAIKVTHAVMQAN